MLRPCQPLSGTLDSATDPELEYAWQAGRWGDLCQKTQEGCGCFWGLFQQFTYRVVREGVITETFPQISAKFQQLSAEFLHSFLMQWINRIFANFRKHFRRKRSAKKPSANDPISELLTFQEFPKRCPRIFSELRDGRTVDSYRRSCRNSKASLGRGKGGSLASARKGPNSGGEDFTPKLREWAP